MLSLAIYGVILSSPDLEGTSDAATVYELTRDLWVDAAQLTLKDSGVPRCLLRCSTLQSFEQALLLPNFLSSVVSASDGIWGPVKPEFVRDVFEQKLR